MKFKTTNYDFFQLNYVSDEEDKNIKKNVKLNESLANSLKSYEENKVTEVNFVKCFDDTYVGINYIEKVTLEEDTYYWSLCLSRVDTSKEAVINDVNMAVNEGRKVYAESRDEGLTIDTAIVFNPFNGVVIIPRNRGGVNPNLLLKFFELISRKSGGFLSIIINNTSINNLKNIDSLQSVEFSIKRLIDASKLRNKNRSKRGDRKIIDKLKAKTMKVSFFSDYLSVKDTVNYLKEVISMNNDGNKEVTKMVVNGKNGEDFQVIDLVNDKLIFKDTKVERNTEGKVTITSMIKSIKKAYDSNKTILALDL